MVIGEAAGAAAALAARAGVPVNCLQVKALQAHLRQQGVSLGEG
jgi:hypothetical protein